MGDEGRVRFGAAAWALDTWAPEIGVGYTGPLSIMKQAAMVNKLPMNLRLISLTTASYVTQS